jgi:peptidoglycan/xylan/chitin deacetylase (PgdA/CDA1 family)
MAGHLIGNHSFYHARMPLLTPDGFDTDVRAAEAALIAACGVDPKPWFRCPFGTGMDDLALLGRLTALGYRNVGWDVDAYDWDVADADAAGAMQERIVQETLARGDGAVVLMHGWPQFTPESVEIIAHRLREADAAFVTLDQLEELPAGTGKAPD